MSNWTELNLQQRKSPSPQNSDEQRELFKTQNSPRWKKEISSDISPLGPGNTGWVTCMDDVTECVRLQSTSGCKKAQSDTGHMPFQVTLLIHNYPTSNALWYTDIRSLFWIQLTKYVLSFNFVLEFSDEKCTRELREDYDLCLPRVSSHLVRETDCLPLSWWEGWVWRDLQEEPTA